MVEFALILPVIMVLFLGMVEMGFAINHSVSVDTAARQGARVGSILVNGDVKCATGNVALANAVDPAIIGAVQGALTSPGSMVDVSQVTLIEIFGVSSNGSSLGTDKYTYSAGNFVASGGPGWPALGRCGATTGPLPDGGAPRIGVRITYNYKFATPLGAFVTSLGSGHFTITDETTMALEPPKP